MTKERVAEKRKHYMGCSNPAPTCEECHQFLMRIYIHDATIAGGGGIMGEFAQKTIERRREAIRRESKRKALEGRLKALEGRLKESEGE